MRVRMRGEPDENWLLQYPFSTSGFKVGDVRVFAFGESSELFEFPVTESGLY